MKKLYPSALLGLLLLTLGCEASVQYPDDHLKLPDLSFEGQKQFCQAFMNEAQSTLDIYRDCLEMLIPGPPKEPKFSWKTRKELDALCKKHRSEWTDDDSHELSEPCDEDFVFQTSKEYTKEDPDILRGQCEAELIECEERYLSSFEEFSFSKGQFCPFRWNCDVTVKQARSCIKALQEEQRSPYSGLELSCEPDTWHRAWKRDEELRKKAEKEKEKEYKLPSACKALEKCM